MSTPDQLSRSLEPGAFVRLFDLDLSPINSKFTGQPGPVLYFHDGVDPVGTNQVGFGGHTYSPFPIKAENFEWTTRGVLPRPTMAVSNIGSVVSALCREYGDLVGGRLVVHQTFARYCAGGSEAGPPWKEFTPMSFVVDRKSSENNTTCAFELATGMDAEGVTLPRRQVLATACPFVYRGVECGYPAPAAGGSGWPVTDRRGHLFGEVFNDGLVSPDGTQLASDLADFRATPPESSDVGKVISGPNFAYGTKVSAVVSGSVVNLSVKATPGSPVSFTINRTVGRLPGGGTSMPRAYDAATTYHANDCAYVLVKGVRVYAVSKQNLNVGHSVYDENWWWLDVCLKKLSDCELHFGALSPLPYGGFPGANKLQ